MIENNSKLQVADFYEDFQANGKYEYLFGDKRRVDLYRRLIGDGKKILEVGCRAGNLTQYYCSGNDIVGVDVDRNALVEFEKKLGFESHWVDVDSEDLPFDSESFDLVVFSEVMEHLRFPQKALGEISRVLRPEGSLVGSVPNAFRLRNRLKFIMGKPFEVDPSHLRSYSHGLVKKELNTTFSKIDIHPVSGHLLGGGSTGIPVFLWLPFTIRALFALDLVFVGQK